MAEVTETVTTCLHLKQGATLFLDLKVWTGYHHWLQKEGFVKQCLKVAKPGPA